MSSEEIKEDDGEDLAQEYRKALNDESIDVRRRFTTEKTLQSVDAGDDDAETPERSNLTTSNDESVYRELSPAENPTFWTETVSRLLPQPIYNDIKPPRNKKDWRRFWEVHVPIWHWLYYYVPKFLLGDIVAGLTIGVTHIPQGNLIGHA